MIAFHLYFWQENRVSIKLQALYFIVYVPLDLPNFIVRSQFAPVIKAPGD